MFSVTFIVAFSRIESITMEQLAFYQLYGGSNFKVLDRFLAQL